MRRLSIFVIVLLAIVALLSVPVWASRQADAIPDFPHQTDSQLFLPMVAGAPPPTATPTRTPTPLPTASPTQTPTPTVGPTTDPHVSVDPTEGPASTQFNIHGSGFRAGEVVDLWLIDESGNRFDDPTPHTANQQGEFGSWVQGSVFGGGGVFTLYARGRQSQVTVSTTFLITP